jgi:2-polyprenyl-3-methyl-5-hydroxy-6-metoxy-1,4-benzoquinol methylase
MRLRTLGRHVFRRRGTQAFAPERYWEKRHQTHRDSLRAVGHVKLPDWQSAEQYELKARRILDVIRRHCTDTTDRSLLDAGCGIGYLTRAFVAEGFEVVGVDFSETAIGRARADGIAAQFLVSPLAGLNLGRRFDVIAAVDVLLHVVNRRDWHATLEAFRGHLKPDGVLVILDWVDARVRCVQPHLRARSKRRYARVLGRLGLQMIEHEQFRLQHEDATKDLLVIKHVGKE